MPALTIQQQLYLEHSAQNADRIAKYISDHPEHLEELATILCGSDQLAAQRSGQVLKYAVEKYDIVLSAQQTKPLIHHIFAPTTHDAVVRNTLSILQKHVVIPSEVEGELYDFCIHSIAVLKSPIAVRAFAMGVAYRIASPYPELLNELKIILEEVLIHAEKGVLSRARNILGKVIKALDERAN